MKSILAVIALLGVLHFQGSSSASVVSGSILGQKFTLPLIPLPPLQKLKPTPRPAKPTEAEPPVEEVTLSVIPSELPTLPTPAILPPSDLPTIPSEQLSTTSELPEVTLPGDLDEPAAPVEEEEEELGVIIMKKLQAIETQLQRIEKKLDTIPGVAAPPGTGINPPSVTPVPDLAGLERSQNKHPKSPGLQVLPNMSFLPYPSVPSLLPPLNLPNMGDNEVDQSTPEAEAETTAAPSDS